MPKDNAYHCGWCMTGHHDSHKVKLEYYDKVWFCGCKTCDTQEKEEKTNEVVIEPIQEQEEESS